MLPLQTWRDWIAWYFPLSASAKAALSAAGAAGASSLLLQFQAEVVVQHAIGPGTNLFGQLDDIPARLEQRRVEFQVSRDQDAADPVAMHHAGFGQLAGAAELYHYPAATPKSRYNEFPKGAA